MLGAGASGNSRGPSVDIFAGQRPGRGAPSRRTFAGMLLAYVMVSLALFASLSWGAETVTVDKTFHGREIKVRAGATIRVQFEQAGATGYEWQVRDLDGEFFEVLTVRTEGPSASEVTGAPVTKVWVIKAKKAGRSQLKFVYYRSWEGEQSEADAFELKVRIP